MLVATDAKGDYAFLNLKAPGVRSERPRRRRAAPAPAGLDAFVYTERGVYRSGETVHVTSLLRDAQGAAALERAADARGRAAGRRRIPPRRGARSGRRRPLARRADQCRRRSTGTWRVRAFTDPKRPAVGETTFLVEDYVPDRLEFDLAAPDAQDCPRNAPAKLTRRRPLSLRRAGLRARSRRRGRRSAPAKERPGFAGYQFGLADEEVETDRKPLEDLPQTDDKGKASFEVALDKVPATTRPLEAQGDRAAGRSRRPRGRAQASRCRSSPAGQHDRREAAVLRPLARRGRERDASTSCWSRPTARRWRAAACATSCSRSSRAISGTAATAAGSYEPIKSTRRIADGQHRCRAPTSRAASRLPVQWGRYRLEVSSARRRRAGDLDRLRRRLVHRSQRRHAGHAGDRARQAGVQAGRQHDGRGHRAHRRHASRST